MKRLSISVALLAAASCMLPRASAEDKLAVSPIGRVHVDGALYLPDGKGFADGLSLPEIRAGAKAVYGPWMARIEIGYSYGKVGMKDVYVRRELNSDSYMRFGYFIPHFGIRGGGSASYMPAMNPQIPETFFRTTTRKIGVSYGYAGRGWNADAAAFVGGRSLTLNSTEQGRVSVGAAGRITWNPLAEPGRIAQVGLSAAYETASHTRLINDAGDEEASEGFRSYSTGFPTAVSKVPMLAADISDVKGDLKISPQLVLSRGRVGFESQFYYMNVGRKNDNADYSAVGAFGLVRTLLVGAKEYSYSKADNGLGLPKPGSLEAIAGYSYTNADCNRASVDGGISNDWSLTLNYYINKYMVWRLRYSYTDVRNSAVRADGGVNIIQTRLQFVF